MHLRSANLRYGEINCNQNPNHITGTIRATRQYTGRDTLNHVTWTRVWIARQQLGGTNSNRCNKTDIQSDPGREMVDYMEEGVVGGGGERGHNVRAWFSSVQNTCLIRGGASVRNNWEELELELELEAAVAAGHQGFMYSIIQISSRRSRPCASRRWIIYVGPATHPPPPNHPPNMPSTVCTGGLRFALLYCGTC